MPYNGRMTLPMDYFPAIMQAIDLIGQGYTKTRACDDAGVSTELFDKYVSAYPQLGEIANAAFTRHYDTLADVLVNIDSDPRHGVSDPKMAAVVSKNIMFYLSRRRPKEYGDRVTVEHTITADKAIVDALTRAKTRALNGPVLDGVSYAIIDGLTPEEQRELEALY